MTTSQEKKEFYQTSTTEEATYHRYAALALPRHTSYPAASFWQDEFATTRYRELITQALPYGISLYVHVPFCNQLCFYCACNKYILPKEDLRSIEFADQLLAALTREIQRVAAVTTGSEHPEVKQLHFGGGTPTWLAPKQLESLLTLLYKNFRFPPAGERAVEIDPRVTSDDHLRVLRDFGFNRVSLGVQDFDPVVQEAVNRIQPFTLVESFVERCRSLGFDLINFDLIYGLPFQTPASMENTLSAVSKLRPSRIAFYRLAVIPEIFKWQRRFSQINMPDSEACLQMNLRAINHFLADGYSFIGLDHFARPEDSLAKALADGTITRTFQGMTTGRGLNVIGIGPSAISQFQDAFVQNESDFFKWNRLAVVTGDFPVNRGINLTEDDQLRRDVLNDLYCHRFIDKNVFKKRSGRKFDEYFGPEIVKLQELVKEGFVTIEPTKIVLTRPLGELLIRVVAAVFDRHLPPDALTKGIAGKASRVG